MKAANNKPFTKRFPKFEVLLVVVVLAVLVI